LAELRTVNSGYYIQLLSENIGAEVKESREFYWLLKGIASRSRIALVSIPAQELGWMRLDGCGSAGLVQARSKIRGPLEKYPLLEDKDGFENEKNNS
jgi:hypothetical protein